MTCAGSGDRPSQMYGRIFDGERDRGVCFTCGKLVLLTKQGRLWKHKPLPQTAMEASDE